MNSQGISRQSNDPLAGRQPYAIRAERGGARLRALFFTVLLVIFAFVSYKVIPPYFANYQLEDWLKTQIPFFMVNHTTDEILYDTIIKEMRTEGIEVTRDNIKIIQNNSRGINVQIDYNVKLDLMVFQTNLHFAPQMNSQSLVQ